MDWYYGSGTNDFLVHKDQDLLDRHPSPDSWSRWEICAAESFRSPDNFLTMDSNATEVEFNFIDENFNNEVGFEPSPYDKDQSSSSSVCGGLSEQSYQQTAISRDQPKYQLQELSSFEQMDDIFLYKQLYKHEPVIAWDSVLEDFPCVENLHKSFYFYPENQCRNTPGGLQKDISASEFGPYNSNPKDCLDIESVKILDPSEQSSGDEAILIQSTFEESALEDLEMIISQFTEKTRICVRDALYRLAKNTKQQHVVEDLDGGGLDMQQEMPWAAHNETLRSEDSKPMESETNSVDRAVANLMFNKMEVNMLRTPANFEQEVTGRKGAQGKSSKALNVAQIYHYPHPQKLLGDAMSFGQSDQQTTTESHISYADSTRNSVMLEYG